MGDGNMFAGSDVYEVKVTHYAELSMREIAAYIAVDLAAPEAAIHLLETFQRAIEALDHMPNRIHLTPEEPWHSEGVRRMPVGNFYVYFWIDERAKKVQVVDVIYMKRDQRKQLEIIPPDE